MAQQCLLLLVARRIARKSMFFWDGIPQNVSGFDTCAIPSSAFSSLAFQHPINTPKGIFTWSRTDHG
jgi:hypothetical protein